MKKLVIFGAGESGSAAFNYFGIERIAAFVDNFKTGNIYGLPIWNIDELLRNKSKVNVIVASDRYSGEIIKSLKNAGIETYEVFEAYEPIRDIDTEQVASYKDTQAGNKCFIIGTGSSLCMRDLNLLKANKCLCIGTNKIFLAFAQTKWRPDYYIATDIRTIQQYKKEIFEVQVSHKFITYQRVIHVRGQEPLSQRHLTFWDTEYSKGAIKIRINDYYNLHDEQFFSTDLCDCIHDGASVTYAAMQLAAYMGVHEIYLLGVDFDMTGNTTKGENHFTNKYFKENEHFIIPNQDRVFRSYQKAEKHSHENGFRIFNATRGGKLEVFERVDFDSLF